MSSPLIIDILEIVRVNEFEAREADSRGVKEKYRFATFKCDGFTLNVRAPFGMEIPVGYTAKAMLGCQPVTVSDRYGKPRIYFTPSELLKLKIGHKVEKIDVLQDFLSSPELKDSGSQKK